MKLPATKGKAMKIYRILIPALLIACLAVPAPSAFSQIGDLFKNVKGLLGGGELSEGKIIQGLKEALEIGTTNAVETVSKVHGYYKNPNIKIPLPGPVKKVERVLRGVGYGPQVDAFVLSMNRAAEKAAPEAKALFWDTIKEMSFADARKILNGRDNEATLYFKEKTQDSLTQTFKPIVHTAMSEVGVTRSYQALDAKVRSIPFADNLSFDLDKYVTSRALDGLFFMLAEEERKIRQNPSARVTDLLKEVFGSKR